LYIRLLTRSNKCIKITDIAPRLTHGDVAIRKTNIQTRNNFYSQTRRTVSAIVHRISLCESIVIHSNLVRTAYNLICATLAHYNPCNITSHFDINCTRLVWRESYTVSRFIFHGQFENLPYIYIYISCCMREVVERLTPFQHFCNYFAQSAIFRETFTFAAV